MVAYSALVPRLNLLDSLQLLPGCRVCECARLFSQTARQVLRLLYFSLAPRKACCAPAGSCWTMGVCDGASGGGPHGESQGSGGPKALHGR
jgi:hypothetical protein